jgi:hypothetical protein
VGATPLAKSLPSAGRSARGPQRRAYFDKGAGSCKAGPVGILMRNGGFTAVFVLSGWLFARAAHRQAG